METPAATKPSIEVCCVSPSFSFQPQAPFHAQDEISAKTSEGDAALSSDRFHDAIGLFTTAINDAEAKRDGAHDDRPKLLMGRSAAFAG